MPIAQKHAARLEEHSFKEFLYKPKMIMGLISGVTKKTALLTLKINLRYIFLDPRSQLLNHLPFLHLSLVLSHSDAQGDHAGVPASTS